MIDPESMWWHARLGYETSVPGLNCRLNTSRRPALTFLALIAVRRHIGILDPRCPVKAVGEERPPPSGPIAETSVVTAKFAVPKSTSGNPGRVLFT